MLTTFLDCEKSQPVCPMLRTPCQRATIFWTGIKCVQAIDVVCKWGNWGRETQLGPERRLSANEKELPSYGMLK